MPLQRCRNFNEDGSRKLRTNGLEVSCRPDCQFVHPSDPGWDRARPSGSRGRGGHPYAPRGRSQSSFGATGSGANMQPLGSNRGTSSNSWDDYISSSSIPAATSGGWGTSSHWDSQAKGETSGWGDNTTDDVPGSSSNPAATSSGWGMSSHWDSQAKVETSGWGDNATGDSGFGSNTNNNVGVPERKSAEPAASDLKTPTSQWGGHGADWGASGGGWGKSDGMGWGSADTGLESGWGQDSTSNQWGNTLPEAAISNVGSSTVAGLGPGRIEDGSDAAKAADLALPVIAADLISSQHDQKLANQPVRASTTSVMGDPLPPERRPSISTALLGQPPVVGSANNSHLRTQFEGNGILESLSTDSEISQLALCVTVMFKMRKLDAELIHWSALRKSPRLVMPRVDKDLLQTKYQGFKDTQFSVKSAVESRTAQLSLLNIPFSSVARVQDTERLHQLAAWVSKAEGCLSDLPAEGDFTLHDKREDKLFSKLAQLKERSDSLAGTRWQCQDPQFYNALLDHQLQDKGDLIISTIVKGQETTYNHLLLKSLSTVQQKGEMWNQKLQLHAGELAQALIQNSDLEKDGKSRSVLKSKEKNIIEKLQLSIAQKRSQIQVIQKEVTQLQHTLTSMNQQSYVTSDPLGVYAPYIQRCIQSYIQGNSLSDIKKAFIKVAEEVEMTEIEKPLLG